MADLSSAPRDTRKSGRYGEAFISAAAAHKENANHLWIDKVTSQAPDNFSLTFQVPNSGTDVRFAELMEVQRQAGLIFAHRCLEIPSSSLFVLNYLQLEVVEAQSLRELGTVQVKTNARDQGRARTRSADLRFVIRAPNGLHGVGSTTVAFVAKSVYARMRSAVSEESASDPEPAARATRLPTRRGLVTIDLSDPILADHATDHVSAMAMICAIENAAAAGRAHAIQSLSIRFLSFAEFVPEPSFEYSIDQDGLFAGLITQSGLTKAAFNGRMTP